MKSGFDMYAVFKAGGKQYRVSEGQTLRIEKIDTEEGATVEFDEVLMVADGNDITVGAPYVDDVKVAATVKAHGRDRKVKIVKFRRRKHYRKQMGHRQAHTEIEITGIGSSKSEQPEQPEQVSE